MTITALGDDVEQAAPNVGTEQKTDGADRGGFLLFLGVATTILLGSLVFGPTLVPSADLEKPFLKLPSDQELVASTP